MNVYNRSIPKIMMIIAIVIVTFMIFFQSLGDYAASHHASDMITNVIVPGQDTEHDRVELIVRKTAHLIEYAILGIVVMLFVKCVERDHLKKLYGAALFYVLLVAVLDEYIQSFSDRTSSTADILLDFLGAMIGFALVCVIFFVRAKLKNRKGCTETVKMVSEAE